MTDTPRPDTAEETADLTAARLRDSASLTPMQRSFCEHALDLITAGERHWRKEAATRAGYKEPRGSAYDLIRMPAVIAYMSRSLTEAAETVQVDRSFVLFRALTNLATCEALGDFRTAARYLDIVAKHADVQAFTVTPGAGDQEGRLSLPFNPKALSAPELVSLIELLKKAGGGQPTK